MTRQRHHIIELHPEAPAKPAEGAACNGCGVCCAWRPCPLGIMSTRSLRGPCAALQWHDAGRHYRCGWMAAPDSQAGAFARAWARWRARLARRWIAAGAGCDSSLETVRPANEVPPAGDPR
jgi:hypothetical protein